MTIARLLVAAICLVGFFVVLSLAKTENVLSVIVGLQYCNFVALLVIALMLMQRQQAK